MRLRSTGSKGRPFAALIQDESEHSLALVLSVPVPASRFIVDLTRRTLHNRLKRHFLSGQLLVIEHDYLDL
jgi:hypothetical protein